MHAHRSRKVHQHRPRDAARVARTHQQVHRRAPRNARSVNKHAQDAGTRTKLYAITCGQGAVVWLHDRRRGAAQTAVAKIAARAYPSAAGRLSTSYAAVHMTASAHAQVLQRSQAAQARWQGATELVVVETAADTYSAAPKHHAMQTTFSFGARTGIATQSGCPGSMGCCR